VSDEIVTEVATNCPGAGVRVQSQAIAARLELSHRFQPYSAFPQRSSLPVGGADLALAAHRDLCEDALAAAHTEAGSYSSIQLSGSSRRGRLFTQVMPFL